MNLLAQNLNKALNDLMAACGLSGESGTEELFDMLNSATAELEAEEILEMSHEEGLCYDMNAALADKLERYLTANQPRGH